jgi:hypothetical protein
MAIGDWMKSETFLSNAGHVMAGALVPLLVLIFTRDVRYLIGFEIALTVYIIVKEYVIDLRTESNETVWTSTLDALGYVAGNAAAWALLFLAKHLHAWWTL